MDKFDPVPLEHANQRPADLADVHCCSPCRFNRFVFEVDGDGRLHLTPPKRPNGTDHEREDSMRHGSIIRMRVLADSVQSTTVAAHVWRISKRITSAGKFPRSRLDGLCSRLTKPLWEAVGFNFLTEMFEGWLALQVLHHQLCVEEHFYKTAQLADEVRKSISDQRDL